MQEKPGYETEDVQTPKLIWAGGILAAVILVSVAAMTLMFDVLADRRDESINSVGPMVDLREKPQGPILQVDPPGELIEMRQRSRKDSETYGWVSRESGTVRIPVDRAMQLVVERKMLNAK